MSLRLDGVSYRYAGSAATVLFGVDLVIEPGEVVGLVGANEAGKTTLCLVAAGLAPATIGGRLDGAVHIDDLTTADARPFQLAQRCGSLFQNPVTQLSGTAPTVWEEIAFGPRNLALPLAEVVARVDEAIRMLGIGDLVARDPARISGGQAQLVALAGVLALRPAYLVLDEPTSQLDPQGTRLVGDALAALAAQRRCRRPDRGAQDRPPGRTGDAGGGDRGWPPGGQRAGCVDAGRSPPAGMGCPAAGHRPPRPRGRGGRGHPWLRPPRRVRAWP